MEKDLIHNFFLQVAENLADELARSDGREVKLEEDADLLNTTFLVPDEGYTCEVIRGVPPGLIETLAPFQHAGLCRLSAQPASNGLWTVYMNVNPMQGSMVCTLTICLYSQTGKKILCSLIISSVSISQLPSSSKPIYILIRRSFPHCFQIFTSIMLATI